MMTITIIIFVVEEYISQSAILDHLKLNKRFQDLENLLKNNPAVGKQSKTVKLLVNEYLSSADIKSACEKTKFLSKEVKNDYLDKFTIYCLINDKREDEAQILFDLMKERGVADIFFENKSRSRFRENKPLSNYN